MKVSILNRFLLPIVLGAILLILAAAFITYIFLIPELRTQLLKRAELMHTTIRAAAEINPQYQNLRLGIEEIALQSSGVYGITLATSNPTIVWASSFHPDADLDSHTSDMLELVEQSASDHVFGEFTHINGDLIVIFPFKQFTSDTQKQAIDLTSNRLPKWVTSANTYQLAEQDYEGILYLRFNWQEVSKLANEALINHILALSSAVICMMLLSIITVYRVILKPIRAISQTTIAQKEGRTDVRTPPLQDNEIGQLGRSVNHMIDALNDRNRLLRAVVDHLPIGLSLKGIDGEKIIQNEAYKHSYLVPYQNSEMNEPVLNERLRLQAAAIDENSPKSALEKISLVDQMKYFETTVFPIYNQHDHLEWLGTVCVDVTDRVESAYQIEQLAYYDPLTEIPNRILFNDRLKQVIADAKRSEKLAAIIYIDLDGFKAANDTFGHSAGDQLLKEAARVMKECIREQDSIARIGGDEFTILIPNLTEEHSIVDLPKVVGRLQDALHRPFSISDNEIHISGSIGVSIYPRDGETPEELLINADIAMYHAKSSGKDRFRFFQADMNKEIRRKQKIESRLRGAIRSDEFVLYYQPQISQDNQVTVEALIRWEHPEYRDVSPSEFIPIAEQSGLIDQLGQFILKKACADFADFKKLNSDITKVAINVSTQQFKRQNLVELIETYLARYKLDGSCLEIEITESLIIDDYSSVKESLLALRDLGISIAIDDFGTGYSFLPYLKELPIDTLKIDKKFISGVPQNKDNRQIVKAISGLAQGFGIELLAEGVETSVQYDFLTSQVSCSRIQGYYFSHPLSKEDLIASPFFKKQSVGTELQD